jgi:predicted Zn-dependent protease
VKPRTRNPLLLPAVLLAVALAGCKAANMDLAKVMTVTENLTKVVAPTKLTPEHEEIMGRDVAATLLGAAPLVRDDALQSYVNRVGGWIALQTGRDDIQWRFGVIDTPNINAFAAPAGYVLITRGLLARLEDESALAGVLAHEIAHVVRRHHAEAMAKKDRAGALAGLATDLNKSRHRESIGALANLAKGVYTAGLDKGDEYEADRLGIVYAARAGYEPYGLPQVLQMYAAAAGESGFELLFSTHPSPQERLDALDLAIGDRLARYEAASISDTASFRRFVGNQKAGQR